MSDKKKEEIGLINEQAFIYENTNEGYNPLSKEEQKKIDKSQKEKPKRD